MIFIVLWHILYITTCSICNQRVNCIRYENQQTQARWSQAWKTPEIVRDSFAPTQRSCTPEREGPHSCGVLQAVLWHSCLGQRSAGSLQSTGVTSHPCLGLFLALQRIRWNVLSEQNRPWSLVKQYGPCIQYFGWVKRRKEEHLWSAGPWRVKNGLRENDEETQAERSSNQKRPRKPVCKKACLS